MSADNAAQEELVHITLHEPFEEQIDEVWLRDLALHLLSELDDPGVLEIVVTDDQTIAQLNELYHGEQGPTDVLSFSAREETEDAFVWPPEMQIPLGEIVVCLPQAERQKRENDRTTQEEVAFLLVHGVLHLLGHDHIVQAERSAMQAQEEDLMERIITSA